MGIFNLIYLGDLGNPIWGTTSGSAQSLFLALYSGFTPGSAQGPFLGAGDQTLVGCAHEFFIFFNSFFVGGGTPTKFEGGEPLLMIFIYLDQ